METAYILSCHLGSRIDDLVWALEGILSGDLLLAHRCLYSGKWTKQKVEPGAPNFVALLDDLFQF